MYDNPHWVNRWMIVSSATSISLSITAFGTLTSLEQRVAAGAIWLSLAVVTLTPSHWPGMWGSTRRARDVYGHESAWAGPASRVRRLLRVLVAVAGVVASVEGIQVLQIHRNGDLASVLLVAGILLLITAGILEVREPKRSLSRPPAGDSIRKARLTIEKVRADVQTTFDIHRKPSETELTLRQEFAEVTQRIAHDRASDRIETTESSASRTDDDTTDDVSLEDHVLAFSRLLAQSDNRAAARDHEQSELVARVVDQLSDRIRNLEADLVAERQKSSASNRRYFWSGVALSIPIGVGINLVT